MSGPLAGFRVVEMAGIGPGPGPFACMLLSDMGAEVIRVERTSGGMSAGGNAGDVLARGRRSIAVNLKSPEGVEAVLKLLQSADALVEGFRPGVMEKAGSRARDMPAAQSATGIRSHDGMGAARPAFPCRRS